MNRKGDDAVAQMATEYTAAEIAFFKAVVRILAFSPISRLPFDIQ